MAIVSVLEDHTQASCRLHEQSDYCSLSANGEHLEVNVLAETYCRSADLRTDLAQLSHHRCTKTQVHLACRTRHQSSIAVGMCPPCEAHSEGWLDGGRSGKHEYWLIMFNLNAEYHLLLEVMRLVVLCLGRLSSSKSFIMAASKTVKSCFARVKESRKQ